MEPGRERGRYPFSTKPQDRRTRATEEGLFHEREFVVLIRADIPGQKVNLLGFRHVLTGILFGFHVDPPLRFEVRNRNRGSVVADDLRGPIDGYPHLVDQQISGARVSPGIDQALGTKDAAIGSQRDRGEAKDA